MNMKDIMAKIAKKEELTAEELTFVSEYQFKDDKPPAKTDDPKVKELEQKLAAEKAEKAELARKFSEIEDAKLTETELLQKKLDESLQVNSTLATENGNLKGSLDGQTLDININKLAAKHNCTDPTFLKYLVEKETDFDFANGDKFMDGLKESSPQHFSANLTPGGGGSNPKGGGENKTVGQARIDELLNKEGRLTMREVGEVTKIQSEINNK